MMYSKKVRSPVLMKTSAGMPGVGWKAVTLLAHVRSRPADAHDEAVAAHRRLLVLVLDGLLGDGVGRQIDHLGLDHRRQALVERGEPHQGVLPC